MKNPLITVQDLIEYPAYKGPPNLLEVVGVYLGAADQCSLIECVTLGWLSGKTSRNKFSRNQGDCCPIHDFLEDVAGESLHINSPEISEHWGTRESQSWPTPWWVTWFIRSLNNCGEGRVKKSEALIILEYGIACNFCGFRVIDSLAELTMKPATEEAKS